MSYEAVREAGGSREAIEDVTSNYYARRLECCLCEEVRGNARKL